MSIVTRRRLVYLVILGSLLMAANLIRDIIGLNRADERLADAQARLRSAQEEQTGLERQLEIIGNDFWLEKQIRNVLKMARPEEVVVVIPEEIVQAAPLLLNPDRQTKDKSNLSLWLAVFGF